MTLDEFPVIRYANNSVKAKLCGRLADLLQTKLDAYKRDVDSSIGAGGKCNFLILDRTVDITAPIVHEFTYQAMAYDLLPIESNKYSYQSSSVSGETIQRDAFLDERDSLWMSLKHNHIAEVITTIPQEFERFTAENKAIKFKSSGGAKSLREIQDAMRAMPQYQDLISKV